CGFSPVFIVSAYRCCLSSSFHLFVCFLSSTCFVFLFTVTAALEIYTLSLHDALPILLFAVWWLLVPAWLYQAAMRSQMNTLLWRSEEHTSELQSRFDLVCRLLLEKKKRTVR